MIAFDLRGPQQLVGRSSNLAESRNREPNANAERDQSISFVMACDGDQHARCDRGERNPDIAKIVKVREARCGVVIGRLM
jgi:hypothetical protein